MQKSNTSAAHLSIRVSMCKPKSDHILSFSLENICTNCLFDHLVWQDDRSNGQLVIIMLFIAKIDFD